MNVFFAISLQPDIHIKLVQLICCIYPHLTEIKQGECNILLYSSERICSNNVFQTICKFIEREGGKRFFSEFTLSFFS